MAKNDIRDIARVLSDKHKLPVRETENFLSMFFDTLNEALNEDKQIKVKGFGTFKVVDVKERESVDVNTGERIRIEGRSKITFTPDSVMKDLVNKPFAQFETVVLNEGIDFSGLDTSESANEEDAIEPDAVENNIADVKEAPVEEVVVKEEEPVADEHIVEKSEYTDEDYDTDESDDVDVRHYVRRKRRKRKIITCVAFVLTTIIAFNLGFFLGKKVGHTYPVTVAEEVVESKAAPKKTYVPAVDLDSIKRGKDSIAAIKEKAEAEEKAKEEAEEKAKEKAEEKVLEITNAEKGENVDKVHSLATARNIMSKGAYEIVGTEQTITVKKGQTLGKISKFYFGDGMECYVQVHNGVVEVKEGDRIKIPKLKIKKRRK